jgi:3-oxoadipate enol-lactonase
MGSAPEETLAAVRAKSPVRRSQVSDWAAAWRSFEGLDVQDRLAGLEIETLVLAGELDASCTPEIMAALAERIPGALYEVLPGTPHMQTLERHELVAQALDRFPPTSMPDRTEHR